MAQQPRKPAPKPSPKPAAASKPVKEKKGGGGKKWLIIIFVILLLGVNGVQLYLSLEDKKIIEDKEQTIVDTKAKLNDATVQLDSALAKVAVLEKQYADLGLQNAELESLKEELLADKASLQKAVRNYKYKAQNYNSLLAKVKAYEDMLKDQDAELLDLRAKTDSLGKFTQELKVTISEKEENITQLEGEKQDLEETVEKAKVLNAHSFAVVGVKGNGKIVDADPIKSKLLAKAQIDFILGPNTVADIENKDVYIQIQEPGGNTVYDTNIGGGSFEAEGREMYYTWKESVMYNREEQKVTVTYEKNGEYTSGAHTVLVYCDGVKIGSGSFNVK